MNNIRANLSITLKLLTVSIAILLFVAGCASPSTSSPTLPPTSSQTITQSSQNQQPIEVISVIEPPQEPNPGGGIVEITLKNVAAEPVVSLAVSLVEQYASCNFDFGVTPSNPLLPSKSINASNRLIGGGWGPGITYSVVINGNLQSGATFAFTWEPTNN